MAITTNSSISVKPLFLILFERCVLSMATSPVRYGDCLRTYVFFELWIFLQMLPVLHHHVSDFFSKLRVLQLIDRDFVSNTQKMLSSCYCSTGENDTVTRNRLNNKRHGVVVTSTCKPGQQCCLYVSSLCLPYMPAVILGFVLLTALK